MNVAHHSAYPGLGSSWHARKCCGKAAWPTAICEARGVFFVVARLNVRFRRPARYDDLLRIRVHLRPCAGVKIEHDYEIFCDDQLLASAQTTLACVDREGKLQAIPPGTLGV